MWLGDRLMTEQAVAMGAGTDDQLFPAIDAVLRSAGIAPSALGAVVCGAGPGSFTSLRIGAALAKGLAHGVQCPLFAVPSLLLAATGMASTAPAGRYVVHADALRGERYVLPVWRDDRGSVSVAGPLARLTLAELARDTPAESRVAVGTSPDGLPSRETVVPTVSRLSQAGGTWREAAVDLALWEPVYGRLAEAQVKWEATHGMALPNTQGT